MIIAIPTLFYLVLTLSQRYVQGAVFTVKNNCPYTIWPATLTSGGGQIPTGFELPSQQSSSLNIPSQWSGRLWARFQCSNSGGTFKCNSGDCGSGEIPCDGHGGATPTTLVEFTLDGSGGNDFYDVSLVDGFNLPVFVQPSNGACPITNCPVDINAQCITELSIRDSNGGVIGCQSACAAFNKSEFCCSAPNDRPETCHPTSYSEFFKGLCPKAYSYAYDDSSSTFTCPTRGDYTITWCP